ncbi:hypothetical protein [Aliiroseovarius sp. 2305UL8-7]|uniref:hypothetical protein n=1 Tax=Aliiroseovarius conchicola TaxID=3121637 RepID=UPI003528A9A5
MAKSRKPAKDKPEKVEDAVVIDEATASEPESKEDAVSMQDEGSQEDTETSETTQTDDGADESEDGVSDKVDMPAEDVAEPAGEVADADPTPALPPKSRPSFMPMLLGGAIAAALGFGAARYPDQWPFANEPVVDPVETKLSAITERLTGVETTTATQSDTLKTMQADTGLDHLRGEMSGELDQMRTQFEALSGKLTDLENRVHTVEKLPQGSGMEAAAAAATAYERELQQMRQMLDAELAKITDAKDDAQNLKTDATATAKAAAARAAMSRVLAALDTGRPYSDALFDLTENAGVTAPEALSAYAETGVLTLSALQAEFPAAARASLDASIRASVSDGTMDRVAAFFRTQLGTRSLEPKEGNDPDAILSRAEAALKDGRLDAVLNELDAMPEAGKPALKTWMAQAKARMDALNAGQTLAQQVNSK